MGVAKGKERNRIGIAEGGESEDFADRLIGEFVEGDVGVEVVNGTKVFGREAGSGVGGEAAAELGDFGGFHLQARGLAVAEIEPLPRETLDDRVDAALRAAGATVIDIPTYRWTLPSDTTPLTGLLDALARLPMPHLLKAMRALRWLWWLVARSIFMRRTYKITFVSTIFVEKSPHTDDVQAGPMR